MIAEQQNDKVAPCGYCAVVMPAIDFYQAYFIVDVPVIKFASLTMQSSARTALASSDIFGAMQAALSEASLIGSEPLVGAASLALRDLSGHDYFYVLATRDPRGTRTELIGLDASSVDQARQMINDLPKVRAIQRRLLVEAGNSAGLKRHH